MTAQLTPLLDHRTLSRIERLRLNPLHRRTNKARGEHLRGRSGQSTDFADYRNYSAGDDVRFVDWNIFARLRKAYLKLYQQEEEMHVTLLIDASTSMTFEDKLQRARELAAAMGVMGLLNMERVSAYVFHQRGDDVGMLRPCTGRVSMRKLFRFIEQIEGGGDAPLEEAVDAMLAHHRGRGIAVVLSDFLTMGELRRSFNLLYSAGLEIFALQILSPTEIEPELMGDLRMVDSETDKVLDVSAAGDLLGLYQEHRVNYERQLEQMVRRRRGRFASVNAATELPTLLSEVLQRRGWVI